MLYFNIRPGSKMRVNVRAIETEWEAPKYSDFNLNSPYLREGRGKLISDYTVTGPVSASIARRNLTGRGGIEI